MINQTIKRISNQLEVLTKNRISLKRALDLMEASTKNIEELIAINTLRESLAETHILKRLKAKKKSQTIPMEILENNSDWLCGQI